MKVLVTGATGFVGQAVCRTLAANGDQVLAAIRKDVSMPQGIETRQVGDLGPDTDWQEALAGADAVIHLAARAHVMTDRESDPLAVFRRINRDGALRLADQASAAGVRRFLFISTIKVNGEATAPDCPYRADDTPAPVDPYGIAKAEAERALAEMAARTGMELIVVRPPLVHGPGAKGNLAALMRVIRAGLPLPLACIDNSRSLVGVANLADALVFLVNHPSAKGTFLVRDGEDISIPELIRRLADAMGRRPLLLPFPPSLLRVAGRLTGKIAAVDRLLGSLVVDDGPLRALGWRPPYSLGDGLKAMASGTVTTS